MKALTAQQVASHFLDENPLLRPAVTYGAPAPLTAPPVVSHAPPASNVKVLEQLVGATVVRLDNGDVINLRLFVDEMKLDVAAGEFRPVYRIVPEVVMRGLPGGMVHDVSGETRN